MYRPLAFMLIMFGLCSTVGSVSCVWAQDLLADWQMSEYDKVHSLLSETSTVENLALTPDQQASLRAVYTIQWEAIPAVSNLLVRSKSVAWSTRHSLLNEADRVASEYKLKQVATVLHPDQWRAVQSMLWREKGLSVVIYDEGVRAQLGVTTDQLERMQQDASRYNPLLDGLNQRLGRQRVAGLRPDEDMSGRQQEVECIERVMQALRADRDRDVRAVLTEEQRSKWDVLVGGRESTPAGLHDAVTNVPTTRSSDR
jgi:hypothetical protein